MRIIVDENMPYGREAFSTLGDVVAMPGRAITRDALLEADMLCVRSVTKVNRGLLEGTPVRWVGTATIGTDHMDTNFLQESRITYCSAPGCNADSVADYITAALLLIAAKRNSELSGKTLGVIGCGNVGSRVVRRARALGMNVLENDPPLARQTQDDRYVIIEELLAADYITCHVPLTRTGPDATLHLISEPFLRRMRRDAILINSSRGAVVDNQALAAALCSRSIAGAALDVWETEPDIDAELMDRVTIATPHIAGYSLEGKVNGTTSIYRQACRWLGQTPSWDAEHSLPPVLHPVLDIDATNCSDESILREAVFQVYPIVRDDETMRAAIRSAGRDAGAAFDFLRKHYPTRREFSRTRVRLQGGTSRLREKLSGLTFQIGLGIHRDDPGCPKDESAIGANKF